MDAETLAHWEAIARRVVDARILTSLTVSNDGMERWAREGFAKRDAKISTLETKLTAQARGMKAQAKRIGDLERKLEGIEQRAEPRTEWPLRSIEGGKGG